MDRKFWESTADKYDDEIFDSLANDQSGVIRSYITKLGSKKSTAFDFGCGIGKYLPILSQKFKNVLAMDLSYRNMYYSRKHSLKFSNIEFMQADLSKKLEIGKADFGLCVNVLIMPSHEMRMAILQNIRRHLKRGSDLILVVPSLESVLWAHARLREWNLKSGKKHKNLLPKRLVENKSTKTSVINGLLELNGELTKHWMEEELVVFTREAGFRPRSTAKVEYSWGTEFDKPPRWMKDPYPWDWLIHCSL